MIKLRKMRFWNIIDIVSMVGIVALLVLILFVPLSFWAKYGFSLLITAIILGLLSLMHSAFVFVKETPKRKWGKPNPEAPQKIFLNLKIKTWKMIGGWAFVIVALIVLWQFRQGYIGGKQCPDTASGNIDSSVTMRYFYSPFCPACWKGETVLQELIVKYPKVRFENYDIRYCDEESIKAMVRGSPAYNIRNLNSSEVVYGLELNKIESAICKAGGC